MIVSAIVGTILNTLWLWTIQFWMWIAGGALAVLAYLFSPALRKYTLAIIALAILLAIAWILGYNSNTTVHTVTHTCDEFRQWLTKGAATDKALAIFKRHGLCL